MSRDPDALVHALVQFALLEGDPVLDVDATGADERVGALLQLVHRGADRPSVSPDEYRALVSHWPELAPCVSLVRPDPPVRVV